MKRYAYKIVHMGKVGAMADFEQQMNELGSQGWRFVRMIYLHGY